MKIRNFIFGIAFICAICFTSCSDGSSSSESNDTSSRVLDLRIKKNGVVYNSSRSIENAAEITQTDHVKATAVSGGIQFEIALPSDASYLEIRRLEDIEGMEDFWTTRCEYKTHGNTKDSHINLFIRFASRAKNTSSTLVFKLIQKTWMKKLL